MTEQEMEELIDEKIKMVADENGELKVAYEELKDAFATFIIEMAKEIAMIQESEDAEEAGKAFGNIIEMVNEYSPEISDEDEEEENVDESKIENARQLNEEQTNFRQAKLAGYRGNFEEYLAIVNK